MTPTPRVDKFASEGIRFNSYYVEAQCTPSRSAILTGRFSVRSGTYKAPLPGEGPSGLSPWEYTLARLLSDAGYATALYGKWHCGEVEGRFAHDMGFDEWWGIKNSWDEAGYTAYPLFTQSGAEPPMIWEGRKGERSKPAMPLDLNARPIVDQKYIIPKTIEYIKREAARRSRSSSMSAIRRFIPRPSPTLPSLTNLSNAAAPIPTLSLKWTFASDRFWTRSKRRGSTTARWSSSAATTEPTEFWSSQAAAPTGRGGAISLRV
jgi:hypothetical protein